MQLLQRIQKNFFLLRNCSDYRSIRAMKGRPDWAPDATHIEVGLRGLPRPLLCRRNSTDMEIIWEIFCNGAYQLKGPFWFGSVLDCGANCGMFAAYTQFRRGTAPVRYIGVEPDPDSFAALRRQVERLPLGKDASLMQFAVSDATGVARFDSAGDSWARRLSDQGRVEVETRSIAEILDAAKLNEVDLAKIDIEGGERPVFETMGRWGARVKAVVAELHGDLDFDWFARNVAKAGFRPFPPGAWFVGMPSAVREDQVHRLSGYT